MLNNDIAKINRQFWEQFSCEQNPCMNTNKVESNEKRLIHPNVAN